MEEAAGAVVSALVAALALGTEGWAPSLTAGASLGSAAPVLHRLLTWLGTQLTPGRTGWGITFALGAVLLAAEALGLWRPPVWAAALVLLETGIGIPVQVWSLTQQMSSESVLLLAVNGAVHRASTLTPEARRRLVDRQAARRSMSQVSPGRYAGYGDAGRRVQHAMRGMGVRGQPPHPAHRMYPYRLRGITADPHPRVGSRSWISGSRAPGGTRSCWMGSRGLRCAGNSRTRGPGPGDLGHLEPRPGPPLPKSPAHGPMSAPPTLPGCP